MADDRHLAPLPVLHRHEVLVAEQHIAGRLRDGEQAFIAGRWPHPATIGAVDGRLEVHQPSALIQDDAHHAMTVEFPAVEGDSVIGIGRAHRGFDCRQGIGQIAEAIFGFPMGQRGDLARNTHSDDAEEVTLAHSQHIHHAH